jgi:CBS domain-containing protein
MPETFERELTPLDQMLGSVGEAMTRDPLVLEPRMRASEAVRALEIRGITGAPVVESGRVVGMFTMTDLMEPAGPTWQTSGPFLRHEHTLAGVEVGQIMTKGAVMADPEWPLVHAAVVMEAAGVNRLPVVDALDRPIGVLTRDDIVRALARRSEMAQRQTFVVNVESQTVDRIIDVTES